MTSSSSPRVFISSASGALLPYRSAAVAVCRRLGMTPVHMEDFDPERPPPVDVCRREVESCDVLVLLLAHRYGSRPVGRDASYTELEYRWAVADDAVAVLAFVVDPGFPWPPGEVDRGDEYGDLARALNIALDCDRMDRDSGREVVPATAAFLLAALGHTDEAARAVDDALARLPRVDEAVRPHHDLASALMVLGRTDEAAEHARAAYRQAWGDGPPFCQHWDLARANRLLDRLGLQPPDLPTLDMSTRQAPLEPEIRRLIARTKQRQGR